MPTHIHIFCPCHLSTLCPSLYVLSPQPDVVKNTSVPSTASSYLTMAAPIKTGIFLQREIHPSDRPINTDFALGRLLEVRFFVVSQEVDALGTVLSTSRASISLDAYRLLRSRFPTVQLDFRPDVAP